MHFPQWAFSHRHCARSGRKSSRSCSWHHTGPPGLGSQSWCSSWQPLPGRFLWGRIYEGSTSSETGHPVAPASRPLETSCLVPGRDAEVIGDLPQEGVYTITSARTLSTRHAYALKLNLFVEWCSSHREDPGKCPIRVVLYFCSNGWSEGCLPPSLNAYVAMIAANHDPVDGKLVGKHDWVIRFLRGARRLNPLRPPSIPSWDLSLVLRALQQGQFDPCKQLSWSFSQNENSQFLRFPSVIQSYWVGSAIATVTDLPVATAPVPPLSGRAPARLLSENLNMRCTCCLLILTLWSAAAGCNNRMPMCIGSFSLHLKWIGLSKRYPNSSVLRRDVSVPSFRERGLHM